MNLKVQPKLIIHGGAGSSLQGKGGVDKVRSSLHRVIEEVYSVLMSGGSASEAVVKGCQMLEDDSCFNAGTGSVLQSDGQVRMSAALMDGTKQSFSGVINITRIQNPIDLAKALQSSPDRVLSDYGAAEFARELQTPTYNPLTDLRLEEWLQERQDDFKKSMAGVVAEKELASNSNAGRGTIGVGVLEAQGNLSEGPSTGG